MMEWIKKIMIAVIGIRPTLVKIVESAQSAIRVIDYVKSEIKDKKTADKVFPVLDMVSDWLKTVVDILGKILSIDIGSFPVVASSVDPVEDFKKKLSELKDL